MAEIFTNIKARILEIAENKGVSKEKFFAELGVSYGNFKGKSKNSALSSDVLAEISAKHPDINIDWVLTGKGNMLRVASDDEPKKERRLIPLYNDVATIGGTMMVAEPNQQHSSPTEYIDAGDWFPGATAAIRHYGDSMVEYPSGSILALKQVEDRRLILWGRNYCIETTEYRITKRLNQSKKAGFLIAYSSNVSTNPDGNLIHPPIDIPIDAVRHLFLVLGCVTKEYSSVKIL